MMTYQEQLKHPKWQKKRLEVLEANKFECENCGEKDNTLHVHHPFYKRGAMIWEYTLEELQCLCTKCHKDAHAFDEAFKRVFAYAKNKEQILGYMTAIEGGSIDPTSYEFCLGVYHATRPKVRDNDVYTALGLGGN